MRLTRQYEIVSCVYMWPAIPLIQNLSFSFLLKQKNIPVNVTREFASSLHFIELQVPSRDLDGEWENLHAKIK